MFAVNATVAPAAKFVPVMVNGTAVAACPTDVAGIAVTAILAIVGAPYTVKILPELLDASGLVTVTVRAPRVAPAVMVMLAVTEVALFQVVEFTVIPVPLNVVVAPVTKALPVITTL